MLIPEAVQLVLHAATIGELNSIYVLDMGEPIRLVDIARDLIRLSGFRADEVPITFIGLRPGEKLDEQLVGRDEVVGPSPVQSVMQVRPRHGPLASPLATDIRRLERSALLGDSEAVIVQLRTIVPEFGPADAVTALPASRAGTHSGSGAGGGTCNLFVVYLQQRPPFTRQRRIRTHLPALHRQAALSLLHMRMARVAGCHCHACDSNRCLDPASRSSPSRLRTPVRPSCTFVAAHGDGRLRTRSIPGTRVIDAATVTVPACCPDGSRDTWIGSSTVIALLAWGVFSLGAVRPWGYVPLIAGLMM